MPHDLRRSVPLVLVLGLLLLACYYPMLRVTAGFLISSEDMAHGLFAPVIALYLAWHSRDALLHPVDPPHFLAIPLLFFAALLGLTATLANSSTFSRFAFLISLAGCLLLIGGYRTFRRFLFPLSLLLFTFPIPAVLYGEITQPLQLLASRLSESAFELLGFSVLRDGNILQLAHMRLSVVEACSGLRSLVTLFFFCLVYAYFLEPNLLLRGFVVLCAIPAAILVNMMRITMTGVLGKYNPAWTHGTYHDMLGWTGFFVGFGFVLLAHMAASRILRSRQAGDGAK